MTRHSFIILLVIFLVCLAGCHRDDPAADLSPLLNGYMNLWNTGEVGTLGAIVDSQFVLHMSPDFRPIVGLDSLQAVILETRRVYPDFSVRPDEVMFTQDAAAVRWTATATHSGRDASSLAGKRVQVPGVSIVHFRGGKVIDEWIQGNDRAWMEQLGLELKPRKEMK
jgi:predicted ester cyclase